jgi:hypothetical protein
MKAQVSRIVFLGVGIALLLFVALSLGDPSFCQSGCGSMTEPLFTWLFSILGAWGPRVLLLLMACACFWSAASTDAK